MSKQTRTQIPVRTTRRLSGSVKCESATYETLFTLTQYSSSASRSPITTDVVSAPLTFSCFQSDRPHTQTIVTTHGRCVVCDWNMMWMVNRSGDWIQYNTIHVPRHQTPCRTARLRNQHQSRWLFKSLVKKTHFNVET